MTLHIENVKPIGVKGFAYISESYCVVLPPRGIIIERALRNFIVIA